MKQIYNYLLQNKYRSLYQLSGFALILAYFFEIIFQLAPCKLCIYQRAIYFALVVLAYLAYKFNYHTIASKLSIIGALILETIIAIYHVALEHHWIEESSLCSSDSNFEAFLTTTKIAPDCSLVFFKFMNLSFAEWNLCYSLFLLYIFFKKS